ncbi:MAG: hypothetical protein U0031_04715 [Thermomicrobiales bacterium]
MTRIRALIFVTMVLAALPFAPWSASAAQDTPVDCKSFASIEEANDYYSAHPEAATAIDDDGDGQACEVYFGLETRDPQSGGNGSGNGGSDQQVATEQQSADEDVDCADFTTQEEAQAVLEADPTDPNNLDPNGDGIACALLPSAASVAADNAGNGNGNDQAAQETDNSNNNGNKNQKTKRNRKDDESTTTEVTCADFATQEDAQAAFDADKEGLAALDEDGDGVVCEELATTEPTPTDNQDRAAQREAKRQARQNGNQTPEPTPANEPTPVAIRDLDCADFATQEEAQAQYNLDPSDPFNLDPNGDGFACSSLPSANPTVVQVPRTGSGWLADGIDLALIAAAAGGGLLAAVGCATLRPANRRRL